MSIFNVMNQISQSSKDEPASRELASVNHENSHLRVTDSIGTVLLILNSQLKC